MSRRAERALEGIGPFEIKDRLIDIAARSGMAGAGAMLNAGRGNPNWIATTPRDAFFVLGRFALAESRRVWEDRDLGGMPAKNGIADRLDSYLRSMEQDDGAQFLKAAVDYGVAILAFDRDAFVHELADSVIGDNYPVPVRMLQHAEAVTHAYLTQVLCGGEPPAGGFDLFAVEGGTAAMCYIFDSLQINRLIRPGDRIAIGAPIYAPYIEMPQLDQYGLDLVRVDATETGAGGDHRWQYPDSEIDKLADPSVKAFFVVNPSNPPSVAIRRETIDRIVAVVRRRNPQLIIITDDVYATFVRGFRSLIAALPHNTIGVYSYSKYFGATGWRLGVVAIHRDNICDRLIAGLPAAGRLALDRRYGSLTLQPEKMKFIDRMVADSRRIALRHTAGLSLPQQAMITLFSLFGLLDDGEAFRQLTTGILHKRNSNLWKGLESKLPGDRLRAGYYADIDMLIEAARRYGDDFVRYLQVTYEPIDILVRLAEQYGTVLLNGSGFDGPPWSVRCSLANLPDDAYLSIGKDLEAVLGQYYEAWKAAKPPRSGRPRRA